MAIFELQKVDDDEVGKWPWGELPSTGSNTPAVTPMALEPTSHHRIQMEKRANISELFDNFSQYGIRCPKIPDGVIIIRFFPFPHSAFVPVGKVRQFM